MQSPILAVLVPFALTSILPAQGACPTGAEPGCICQPPAHIQSGVGAGESQNLSTVFADSFTTGALPVVWNRVAWWGGYWRPFSQTCFPGVREFTITLYSSTGTVPDQPLTSFDVSEAVPESLIITPTNQTFSAIPAGTFESHKFSCPAPRITLAANTEYWIEIKGKGTSLSLNTCRFAWEYSNTNASAATGAAGYQMLLSQWSPVGSNYAWCIETIPAASCTVRNGSGINPVDFTCGTRPIVGTNWQATIATNPNTVITFIAVGLTGPNPGFPFLGGEFLLDPGRPIPRLVPGNGSYSVPIPPDAMDIIVHTQGIRVDDIGGVTTIVLLNAQRLVLGL